MVSTFTPLSEFNDRFNGAIAGAQQADNDVLDLSTTYSGGGAPQTALSTSPEQSTQSQPQAQLQAQPQMQPPMAGQPSYSAPTQPVPTPTTSAIQAGQYDAPQVGERYQQLFSPIQSGIQSGRQELSTGLQQFSEAAGPFRTYEGIGGQQTLQEALNPAATTAQDQQLLDQARGLVQAEYQGPQRLSGETAANVGSTLQDLQAQARSLTGAIGVEDLLRRTTTGLSSGQRRAEARSLLQDPEFRAARTAYSGEIQDTVRDLQRSQAESEAIANIRAQQEQEIQEASKDYLEGRYTDVYDTLTGRVEQKETEQQAVEAMYDKFIETGDPAYLAALPEEFRSFFQPTAPEGDFAPERRWDDENLISEHRRNLMEAAQKYTDIAGQFPESIYRYSPGEGDPFKYVIPSADALVDEEALRAQYPNLEEFDIPGMQLGISGHGRERFEFPQEWWDEHAPNLSEGQRQTLKKQMTDRQAALVEAGFSPGTATTEEGDLAAYLPLWFGQAFDPVDQRPYVSFQMGVRPSIQNVSTEEERGLINRINSIVDHLERNVEAPEVAYNDAMIAMDVEGYMADEEKNFSEQKEGISQASEEWKNTVRYARKKYRKAKKKSSWGKIGRVVGGIGSLGLTEVIGGVTGFNPAETLGYAAADTQSGDYGSAAKNLAAVGATPTAVGGIPKRQGGSLPLSDQAGQAGEMGNLADRFQQGPRYPSPVIGSGPLTDEDVAAIKLWLEQEKAKRGTGYDLSGDIVRA